MYLVFIAEEYYPEGGAADFHGTVTEMSPESMHAYLMKFMADLAQGYFTATNTSDESGESSACHEFHGFLSVFDTVKMKSYGSYIAVTYGGRSVRLGAGKVYTSSYGYSDDRRELPPVPLIETQYRPDNSWI